MTKNKVNPGRSLVSAVHRRMTEPRRQDSYRSDTKPKGTPRCPICRSVCVRGRWIPERNLPTSLNERGAKKSLSPVRQKKEELICPACRQTQDLYAGGVVELHGTAWPDQQGQIFEMIAHTEEIARNRNDQMRVIRTRTYRGVTKVYVTLPELARQIGRMLEKTFKGITEYHTSTEEPYRRVIWNSDGGRRPALKRLTARSKHRRNRGAT